MINIAIIGSDSFIASQFFNSIEYKENIKLYSRQASGKKNEMVKEDLFKISSADFKDSDVVINFAAIVHQPNLNDNTLYKKVNTDLAIHFAQEAKKAGVKHFIQMSTIAVYGNVNSIDIYSPENPDNTYGATKLAADKALMTLQDKTFKVSIIRPPMVYGGGNAPGNMMKLIKYAQKGVPMPFKRVNNERDFIHVLNLVNSIFVVIQNTINGIILPTDKKAVSTSEIIDLVKVNSLNPVRQIRVPKFILAVGKKLIPSIYNKIFGSLKVECNLSEDIYRPNYTIEDGIKEMISFLEHS